jgi:hypothetical protein
MITGATPCHRFESARGTVSTRAPETPRTDQEKKEVRAAGITRN